MYMIEGQEYRSSSNRNTQSSSSRNTQSSSKSTCQKDKSIGVYAVVQYDMSTVTTVAARVLVAWSSK